jgi:molybdopterin molybdotransferase
MHHPTRTNGRARSGRPASLAEAITWVDHATSQLPAEEVLLDYAADRVVADDCRADRAIPERHRAALDGFAVAAQQSVGAGAYNPLALPAIIVAAGDPLPAGTDTVVPLAAAELEGIGAVSLVEPVASGENVRRAGAEAAAGAVLVSSGTRLAARHIGLLAAAGIGEIAATRRPRVSVLLVGPSPSQGVPDSNRPMLRALVRRDGGEIVDEVRVARDWSALTGALAAVGGDIALVVGGTGDGHDDHAAAALAEAGELVLHGVALRPGETTGCGLLDGTRPVLLLPGAPASCLWSYEFFAGRAIRRLGGRDPALPFRRCQMTIARKIVSVIGMTEICPVCRGEAAGSIEPLPSFAEIGLAATAADGFVIVPQASEGYPHGARATVHLYQDFCGGRIWSEP